MPGQDPQEDFVHSVAVTWVYEMWNRQRLTLERTQLFFLTINLTWILVGFPFGLDCPVPPQVAGFRTESQKVQSNPVWPPAARMPPSSHHMQIGPGSRSPDNCHLLNVLVWNGLEKGNILRASLVSWKNRNSDVVSLGCSTFPSYPNPTFRAPFAFICRFSLGSGA